MIPESALLIVSSWAVASGGAMLKLVKYADHWRMRYATLNFQISNMMIAMRQAESQCMSDQIL